MSVQSGLSLPAPIGAGSCQDLNDLLLFSCLTACVTRIVIAAASLL
jgi:hypothetical protein